MHLNRMGKCRDKKYTASWGMRTCNVFWSCSHRLFITLTYCRATEFYRNIKYAKSTIKNQHYILWFTVRVKLQQFYLMILWHWRESECQTPVYVTWGRLWKNCLWNFRTYCPVGDASCCELSNSCSSLSPTLTVLSQPPAEGGSCKPAALRNADIQLARIPAVTADKTYRRSSQAWKTMRMHLLCI